MYPSSLYVYDKEHKSFGYILGKKLSSYTSFNHQQASTIKVARFTEFSRDYVPSTSHTALARKANLEKSVFVSGTAPFPEAESTQLIPLQGTLTRAPPSAKAQASADLTRLVRLGHGTAVLET